ALLIVGSNPRKESPVLNARIRKRWLKGNFPIGVIGEHADLTYHYQYLGAGTDTLNQVVAGQGFGEILAKAQKPLILVGQGALTREDGLAVLSAIAKLNPVREGWNGFSVLHTAAARVGGLDVGFVPQMEGLSAQQMVEPGAFDV